MKQIKRKWHVIAIVVLICVPVAVAGATDSRESKAYEQLKERVAVQSSDSLSLTKFAKTNGYDKVLDGTKMYVMEWSASVVANQEIWKPGNAIGGFWQSFAVFAREPAPLEKLQTGGAQRFDAGTRFDLTGTTLFRLTDLGWRPENISIVSAKAFADSPKPNSKSAFVGTWRVVEVCDDCMKVDEALRITEMNSGLFKLEKAMFDLQGRPNFTSMFAQTPISLRVSGSKLTGVSNETGVPSPVTLELDANGKLTCVHGDFLPKHGSKLP